MDRIGPRIAAFGTVFVVLGFAGCGTRTSTVSGTVSYRQTPLHYGFITFVGKDLQPIRTAIQPDGRYSLKGVPFGEVKVAVVSPDPSPKKAEIPADVALPDRLKKRPTPPSNLPPGVDPSKWFAIPQKCSSWENSGILLTVTDNSMQFDIELKDE